MTRKGFPLVLAALLVSGILLPLFYVEPVKATGTVYIRADGSIDPPDAPISTIDNTAYTLTGNITSDTDGIVIERDNIVVDGFDFSVEGAGTEHSCGIHLEGRSNVTIQNTEIKNFSYGILLLGSADNSIYGNTIMTNSSSPGITLEDSLNTNISGNTITNNGGGGVGLLGCVNVTVAGNTFRSCGFTVDSSYSSSVENNTVNGKPLVYLEGVTDYTVEEAGQVVLVRCNRIRVENLTLSQTSTSVLLWETSCSMVSGNTITMNSELGIKVLSNSNNNTISDNIITDNSYGIGLSSLNSNMSGNTITNNDCGIWLVGSRNCRVSENTIANNTLGISAVLSSANNNVSGNTIVNNRAGILLSSGHWNCIRENNITNNSDFAIRLNSLDNSLSGNTITNNGRGIWLSKASNNTVCHNNFVNNTVQVDDESPEYPNFWLWNGCEGNFWSNYEGMDLDNDGIGDTFVPWEGGDNCPLLNVYWSPCDINHDLRVDMKDISHVAKPFNTRPEDPAWNPHADITGLEPLVPDEKIDMKDISLVAKHFNERYS